jgi:hypothetical protein
MKDIPPAKRRQIQWQLSSQRGKKSGRPIAKGARMKDIKRWIYQTIGVAGEPWDFPRS